jgi:hypothetical protein
VRRVDRVRLVCAACGTEFEVYPYRAKSAKCCSQSCSATNRFTTHDKSRSRLYGILKSIKQRCENENHKHFDTYGGRGITVCDEWSTSFESFDLWASENGYQPGLEIDRIDTNRGYSPDNCRWVTRTENNRNTRKKKSGRTSKYKGVWFDKHAGCFKSAIRINGKKTHLGSFRDDRDGALAYDAAARKHYGQFAHCNFPES